MALMRKSAFAACALVIAGAAVAASPVLSPVPGATGVNPDTHLRVTFTAPPILGATGRIRVHDIADGSLVDTIDVAIPVSPRPDGRGRPAPADPNDRTEYQRDVIGGTDFHYFPVTVRGATVKIDLHNGVLQYGRRYRVTIDDGVFAGTAGLAWTFATKRSPPRPGARRVVVAADGRGDFDTVQGAIDFLPAKPSRPVEIFIRNGDYEELVFARDKANFTLRGEDRAKVRVHYRNNSSFNPSRGGPSRRPAFSLHDVADVQLSTFTIANDYIGQAEALLVRGERVVVDRMTLNGSGDALTTYGTIYMVDSLLTGHGDTILGYAALYCLRCELRSLGPMTWTRTPQGSHGNVFVDSTLIGLDEPLPWTVTPTDPGQKTASVFARLPRNSPGASAPNFPYAEMVLIGSRTSGVSPEGWGPVEEPPGFDRSNVRFMEFDTRDLDGKPVDLSRRHPIVRKLALPDDAATIANYRDPAYVLGGWRPVVRR
jgi:pectinesterase